MQKKNGDNYKSLIGYLLACSQHNRLRTIEKVKAVWITDPVEVAYLKLRGELDKAINAYPHTYETVMTIRKNFPEIARERLVEDIENEFRL